MRKRIRQLARGKFDFSKPEISFAEDTIELEVMENTDYSGSFTIAGNNQTIRGLVYVTNPRMEVITTQFEGEECVIRYQFHGRGLVEGENQTGEFVIVCNQCEYSLSFCVNISKKYMDSSVGPVKTLYDFANLAKENWSEAFEFFYNKNFPNIIKPKEIKEAMLYRGITSAKPSGNNLEEFLVGVRKKEPIHFSATKTTYVCDDVVADRMEVIELHKDNWGYLELDVAVDAPYVRVSKEHLTSDDFMGSTCRIEVYIASEQLHAGKNFARVTFTSPLQEVAVDFEIQKVPTDVTKKNFRSEINEYRAGMMELYQAYRLKKIATGAWANETIEILDHLHAMDPDEPMYPLMKAQVLIINRQRQEAEWILDEFHREWVDHKDPVYGFYLYVMTLLERESNYVDRMTREIEGIFHENPDSVMLFWVLSFLQDEYYNNNSRKLKAIEYWVMKGCSSPYLYLEAYYLIWQDPYLLTKLDTFEIRILRWAIRHRAITKDIAIQIFQIVEMTRGFDPVLYQLLEVSYEVDQKPANVGMICNYLIKGQQYDKKYHHWFEKGIELELRITGLYEAYLLSMDEHEVFDVPKIIQMYFQYENTLNYRKMAVLYSNIIVAKDTSPEVYNKYRRVMGRFAMEQVEAYHIDDNLAIVYRDMLELGVINEDLAHAMAHIIFANKLTVKTPGIVRALIYQRQLKDPQIVPVTEGVAYFQLYSKEYVIVFEDAKGRRFVGSVDYSVRALMDPQEYLEKCMEFAPDELAFVLSYFTTRQNYLTFTKEDQKYFGRVLFGNELSVEYKAAIIPEIIRFYQTCEYDGVIKRYLEETEFDEMPSAVRKYMIELLVENHIFDKAFEMIGHFGVDQIGSAGKVALSTYLIKEFAGEEEDVLLSLVTQAFLANKYNDVMLAYLCKYYLGPTNVMCAIWKAASIFELDTFELEERILVQMLYTEKMHEDTALIFKSYYDNGGREQVVLAYLSYRAHEYFLHNAFCEQYVFDMIEARYCNRLELNDACKLALLRRFADEEEVSKTHFAIEDELLAEYTCRNMNFAFYKRLAKELVVKYHFYDKIFLEYRCNPRKHVVLHYSRDEDGENFVTEDMPDVYDGIFVKSFVMFFGEAIQYYISEEYKGEVSVTESNRLMTNDVYGENDSSRYNLVNQMLISLALQDSSSLYHNMKQYKGYAQVTNEVFHLI